LFQCWNLDWYHFRTYQTGLGMGSGAFSPAISCRSKEIPGSESWRMFLHVKIRHQKLVFLLFLFLWKSKIWQESILFAISGSLDLAWSVCVTWSSASSDSCRQMCAHLDFFSQIQTFFTMTLSFHFFNNGSNAFRACPSWVIFSEACSISYL
jgi:hypothetical protein